MKGVQKVITMFYNLYQQNHQLKQNTYIKVQISSASRRMAYTTCPGRYQSLLGCN